MLIGCKRLGRQWVWLTNEGEEGGVVEGHDEQRDMSEARAGLEVAKGAPQPLLLATAMDEHLSRMRELSIAMTSLYISTTHYIIFTSSIFITSSLHHQYPLHHLYIINNPLHHYMEGHHMTCM